MCHEPSFLISIFYCAMVMRWSNISRIQGFEMVSYKSCCMLTFFIPSQEAPRRYWAATQEAAKCPFLYFTNIGRRRRSKRRRQSSSVWISKSKSGKDWHKSVTGGKFADRSSMLPAAPRLIKWKFCKNEFLAVDQESEEITSALLDELEVNTEHENSMHWRLYVKIRAFRNW